MGLTRLFLIQDTIHQKIIVVPKSLTLCFNTGSYYRRAFKMKLALPILMLVVMVCTQSNANPTGEVQLSSASEVRMPLGQEPLAEDRRGRRCGVRCRRQKTKNRCKTRCKKVYISGKYRQRCYGRCNEAFG